MRSRAQLSLTVDRGHRSPVAVVASVLLWAAVACVLLLALAQGLWTTATAAAASIFLALAARASSALAGIVLPEGLTTGILAYNVAALLAGEVGGLYLSIWWWDIMLHLVASAVLSVVGMALVLIATGSGHPPRFGWLLAVLALGFSMMVGAMWELMEYTLDAVFGTNTQRSGLPDTMGDMAANLAGGTVGALIAYDHLARGARWPLGGLLGRFIDLNPALYPARRRGRPTRR